MIIGNNTPFFPENTDYKKKELAKVFHEQANVIIAKVNKYCVIHVVFNVISVMQILMVD